MLIADLTPILKKKKNLTRFFMLFIQDIAGYLTVVLLILASMFLLTDWYIHRAFTEKAESLLALPRFISRQKQDMTSALSLLNDALIVQENFNPTVPIILPLISAAPEGIKFANLSFDKQSSIIQIQGVALNRSLALQFQKTLSELPHIASAVLPIETLTQQNNLPFTVTITIPR